MRTLDNTDYTYRYRGLKTNKKTVRHFKWSNPRNTWWRRKGRAFYHNETWSLKCLPVEGRRLQQNKVLVRSKHGRFKDALILLNFVKGIALFFNSVQFKILLLIPNGNSVVVNWVSPKIHCRWAGRLSYIRQSEKCFEFSFNCILLNKRNIMEKEMKAPLQLNILLHNL